MKSYNTLLFLFLLLNFQKCTFGNSNLEDGGNYAPANNMVYTDLRQTDKQIILNPNMVYSNCGCFGSSPFSTLVDEQNLQVARSEFLLPGDQRYNKAQFIFDLQGQYQLSGISFFELAGGWRGKDSIFIYTGNPSKWRPKGYITTKRNRDQWDNLTLNDSSRYVMIEFNIKIKDIAEVVLFGSKIVDYKIPITQINTGRKLPTMDKLMGATGGLWENEKLVIGSVSALREFHTWNWNDAGNDPNNHNYPLDGYKPYPDNFYNFNPDFGLRHTDEDYKRLSGAGIELNPCLQTSALYFINGDNENNKPVFAGQNPNNPESYKAHADYLFQYTARYGSNAVDKSLLKLDKNKFGPNNELQPIVSGLNVVKSIENWNEPDKWWHPAASYFSPFQFAAMCSADYDAHEGTLGKNVGVKNADPNMKFVMGGLAALNIEFIKGMKLWSDYNRTKTQKFPADVLNFHHYCNSNEGKGQPILGISPEQDGLKNKLKKVVAYRNAHLPKLEIWLTEFGYDTNEGSSQVAPAIGNTSSFEVQGRWLLRSFLEIAAAGIDRAFLYNFEDYGFETNAQYMTSGMVKGAPGNEKKISWYYMACLKNVLKGYSFLKEIPSGQAEVNVYCFKSTTSNKLIYAVWCNTSANKEIFNFNLNVKGNKTATVYTPTANDNLSSTQIIQKENNGFYMDKVSELPQFIEVNN
jgi:hypothetical protein